MDSFAIAEPAAISPKPDLLLLSTVAFAFVVGFFARVTSGWGTPLWFDETFTAVIASQSNLDRLFYWMRNEVSGPVFYGSMWGWAHIAGHSAIALRIPSFAYSIAAPLIALFWGHSDHRTRLIWAALLALWSQGFSHATEARPYALLTLLSVAQTIAFGSLLRAPTTRRASLWVGICSLGVLTHYYVIVIATVQGVLYLASAPRQALRNWPAALLLIPVFGWISLHLSFVLAYAEGGAWYNYVDPKQLYALPTALIGYPIFAEGFALLTGATALYGLAQRFVVHRPWPANVRVDTLVVSSSLIALAIVIGSAIFNRSFTGRYLVPFVPPLLLGLGWWMRWLDDWRYRNASAFLIATMAGAAIMLVGLALRHPEQDRRYSLNFDQPSVWLRAHGATSRLVFFWDNPTGDRSDPHRLAEVGSYFLREGGSDPEVVIPHMPVDADPNPRLLAMAGENPHAAILWTYDRNVPFSRGIRYPARISAIDKRWICRRFGANTAIVMACARRSISPKVPMRGNLRFANPR